MSSLVIVVPSRGRPGNARDLADKFEQTCTADTALLLALDGDDATVDEYVDTQWTRYVGEHRNMVQALNMAAVMALTMHPKAVGFMGDDHAPRTVGWDRRYLDALGDLGTGIVYGDDLLQGERLPTQCAMTADIVRALGYMAPPVLTHMYVDNFWLDLGRAAGCIRYLPDVIVEHVHPVAGKVDWDEGHRRVNAPSVYETDRTAYTRFRADGSMATAVAKVGALR